MRAEVSEMETKGTAQRTNETKRWFFKEIEKPLARLAKIRERRAKLIKNWGVKGDIIQITMKPRGSLGNILKMCIPIN
jgi:hypothetical protein